MRAETPGMRAETPGMTYSSQAVEELGCLLNTVSATAAWATCAGSQTERVACMEPWGRFPLSQSFSLRKG